MSGVAESGDVYLQRYQYPGRGLRIIRWSCQGRHRIQGRHEAQLVPIIIAHNYYHFYCLRFSNSMGNKSKIYMNNQISTSQ